MKSLMFFRGMRFDPPRAVMMAMVMVFELVDAPEPDGGGFAVEVLGYLIHLD